jgi:sugar lactone lactonase YvrE
MKPARLGVELAFALRADLSEGPVWDTRVERLHCVDITTGLVHTCDPVTGGVRTIELGAMVGCVVPAASGGLVAALADGIWAIDPASGVKRHLITPPEHDAVRCRFNDGKCDPQGRLWAGTMGRHSERSLGALYCFPSAAESRCVLREVSISNGLAWSRDQRTFFYIDSPTRCVDAFDFEPDSGEISRRRTVVALPSGADLPDGCTVDAEGMLWIAHWGGRCVTRWDPTTGRQLATVSVPAPHVTSCAFGGARHDVLYITTARRGLDAAQLAAFPESGSVFACRPGVGGLPANVFRDA